MNITLDIAAALSAVIWPVIVLVILLAYRSRVPMLVEGLASRVKKLEFAGVSLELALAKPFVPEWSGAPTALDLRHKATAIQVQDSTARTFLTQLTDEGTGDYAEINLGTGSEWLTSRLFIMAIVFARMKGIECFVFVETSGGVRKRFVGWAEPATVRWALARRYPWLEQAYANAYAAVTSQRNAVIVSAGGRLGYPYAPADPGAGIDLLKEFLERVQQQFPVPLPPPEPEQWVVVDDATNTHEHASWVSAEALEQWLSRDLHTDVVRSSELRSKSPAEQVRLFLTVPARFVGVVGDEQRFEYLLRRDVLVEQVARAWALDAAGRTQASSAG
jgi:hypothetical protein